MTTYRCWIPEYGHERADGRDFDCWDAETAAKEYVEWYEAHNAEYPVASGSVVTVMVDANGLDPRTYAVTGEACPHYAATEVFK